MESLAALVRRDGPLDAQGAVGWTIRLCKRVEQLHALGVAHGGLSAECVLVGAAGPSGFGALGDVRQAVALPAYHSPERHAGGSLSEGDDTWAVAVVLYFLLTGSMPFEGRTPEQIHARVRAAPPAPLAVYDVGDDALQEVLDTFLGVGQRGARLAALRAALEGWGPSLGELPPLDEVDDEITLDDDDEVLTVMRDFGALRERLRALHRESTPGVIEPAPDSEDPDETVVASRLPLLVDDDSDDDFEDDFEDDDDVATRLLDGEAEGLGEALAEARSRRGAALRQEPATRVRAPTPKVQVRAEEATTRVLAADERRTRVRAPVDEAPRPRPRGRHPDDLMGWLMLAFVVLVITTAVVVSLYLRQAR